MTELAVEFLNHWFILDTNTGNMKCFDDSGHTYEVFNEKKFLARQKAERATKEMNHARHYYN